MKRIVTLLLAMLPLSGAFAQTASDRGISVNFSVRRLDDAKAPPRAGEDAEVAVRVHDKTGAPIRGAGVNGWLSMHPAGAPPLGSRECVARVATFTAGGLFNQPALDLNTYRVVVLNADATLSVIDPKVAFGGTSLLAIVQLEAPAEDWTVDRERRRIFVAMPGVGKVAVVDTTTWKVIASIQAGPRAGRVVTQPDGGYVWVAYDGGVAAIDPRKASVVARIRTGSGAHDLAVSDDSETLFVTNAESGTTSVVDVHALAVAHQVRSGGNPVSVAWSQLARNAFVTSGRDGAIVAIDPHRAEPRARITAAAGISRIRFAPGGRLAFITNPDKDAVYILDATSNRIVQTAIVEKGPFEVTFSETIAYVRHLHSETVLMITLANVGSAGAKVSVADFPGGQRAFGATGVPPIPADGIVQAAGENAVLVTNPADGEIYYYREGMAAPSADLSGYSHVPRAILVVDRSLREVKPGLFTAIATMPKPGLYDVALFVDAPRVVTCFQLTVDR
jgi:YVTN family beta-propeller protein